MKRTAFLLFAVTAALGAWAKDGYAYLTFETTDGAKVSVSVSGLALNVSGNTLIAGEKSFVLTNLSRMYFSTGDETVTGVVSLEDGIADDAAEVYDLQGHRVNRADARKGVYIVRSGEKSYKIVVR